MSLLYSAYSRIVGALPDELAVKMHFYLKHGYLPNIANPATFSEKIQNRKLYGRTEKYGLYVDKLRVKDYVADVVGERYVIETLWSGKTLPRERIWQTPCVIKSNYGSGNNAFVRSADELRSPELDKRIAGWERVRHPAHLKERVYEGMNRSIFAEPFLGENLSDYKIYVFDGKAKYIHVDTDRFIEHKRNFFDRNWTELPVRLQYPRSSQQLDKPARLAEMLSVSEELASPFDFARVDLYVTEQGIKFGELTFLPGSGMERFVPAKYDMEFGNSWHMSPT